MTDSPAFAETQSILKKAFPASKALSVFTEKVQHRPLYLHATLNAIPNPRGLRQKERLQKKEQLLKRSSREPKALTAGQKRALKVHEIPLEAQKYAIYEPLHQLWVGYMQEVLQMSPGTGEGGGVGANQAQIGLKLASADYHGALFEVVRSRCPSRVGIKGICVKETKSMFYIITESSGMKEVPKEHTVFRFQLPVKRALGNATPDSGNLPPKLANDATPGPKSMVFELHGSQFMYRAAERVGRKFKQKPGSDL